MNKKIKFILAVVCCLTVTSIHAGRYQEENNKEQCYTNGFSIGVGSNSLSSFFIGYYLGKNNQWQPFFGISPYSSVTNYNGYFGVNSWSTLIFAGLRNYIPLMRQKLNNQFFLMHGPTWGQNFGINLVNQAKLSSNYFLGWGTGFMYRLNGSVYIGVETTLVGYSEAGYTDTSKTLIPTNSRMKSWSFLANPTAYISWKI
ncbi:MAG: hypothetical protein S4CHLAM7_04310 [Chlamydiae bacterium]|nr:hypothetical protein [Chlamydiota bacterium]